MTYPTRVRYGLRLLVHIAMQGEGRAVSLSEIAAEEKVSLKYLEQIVTAIRSCGILRSSRGPGGGYVLTREPAAVTLEEIFTCLGAMVPMAPCLGPAYECERSTRCRTRQFWDDFDTAISSFLRSKTLADLLETPCGMGI